jgi:hypothetical protein
VKAFDVHIRSKDLEAFRRRVLYYYRKFPKVEYMEVIFIRQGVGTFHIESFHKLRFTKRDTHIVDCDDLQYQELKNQAFSQGLSFGTIHTHTVCDSAASKYDIVEGVREGEALLGVCEVDELPNGRMKTTLDFWIPQLPCTINQIRD